MKGLALFMGVLLTGLTAAALPARADSYSYTRTVDRSISAAGSKAIEVAGVNGNIDLYGDGGTAVRVHAVLRARSEEALHVLDVRTVQSGGAVRVEDVCPQERHFIFWSFADCDIELEVHYPRALDVTLSSQNGNVTIDGARAGVSILNRTVTCV
ncbi:MAG TPA: hypothetical protein VJP85_06015 [Candidatus Baltobacteraceae bacterium]|nr:hypothetical protein [Candidatus Baltobacteraceae bacterium]